MASNGISIAISADDQASRVIAKVNKGFQDFSRRVVATGADTERFTGGLKKLDDGSGIDRVAKGFGEMRRGVAGVVETMGRFAPALAGITSAASVAGVAQMVERWTTFGSRLGADARRIGMSAEHLHGLQGAARLAGSSAEALTDGMKTLGDNLVNAVAGRSPQTVYMLSQLGLGFRDASTGGVRLAEDVLPEIAQKIALIHNPTRQALILTTLFGGAGEALIPLFQRMAAGTAASSQELQRYGLMNAKGVKASEDLRDAQTRLGLAAEGVGYSISQSLAPVLVPLLDRLSGWVADHREDIAAFFERVAKGLQSWVDNGGLADMLSRLETLGRTVGTVARAVDTVVTALGGWQLAAEVLLTFMAGRWAMGMVASVGRVTGALGSMRAAVPGELPMPRPRVGGLTGQLGTGSMLGIGLDMLNGSTPEQQHAMNVDSPLAHLGQWLGGYLGMTFDGEGRSHGLLDPWLQRSMPTWLGGRAGPGGGPGAANAPPLPQGEQAARARAAFDAFRGMGDTPEIAAARVANIQVESRFDERAMGDNGQAYGLGQWHPDRQRQFAAMFGHDIRNSTRDEQLRFLHDDPDAQSRANNEVMRARPPATAFDAGGRISRFQERPGDTEGEAYRRGVLAERYLQRYRGEGEGAQRTAATLPPPAPPLPPLAPPVPLPPMPAAGQAGPNGRVAVDINFQNQPPGLRMTTSTEGGVTVRAPRIETAMPGWALP